MNDFLKKLWSEDHGSCGCGCGCDHYHEHEEEDDPVLEIVDPETGEKFNFYFADEFEFEGNDYCVLVTMDEENPEYVIGRMVEDEKGESFVETLSDDENDAVYRAYEELLEEYFEEEEEAEEE